MSQIKIIAEDSLTDLLDQIGKWNELGKEQVTISMADLNLFKECYLDEQQETVIDDTRLYIDYVETLATQLETTYANASKLVDDDTMESVMTDMFQAETDHIAEHLPKYEAILEKRSHF